MHFYKLAVAFATTLLAAAAQADVVVYSHDFGNVEHASPGSFSSQAFSSQAGAGTVDVKLDGFASLDGRNSYEDDFTLSLNGSAVLVGTWDLGGGGDSLIISGPTGASWQYVAAPSGTGVNRAIDLSLPVSLLSGGNVLTFAYDSLTGPGLAGPQGTGDEGWGVGQVTVSAVPEPTTIALLLTGLGLLGGVARRRSRKMNC